MVGEKYLLDFTSSYYAKGLRDQKNFNMVHQRVEDVLLSIFVRAVNCKHTKPKFFFERNIYTFFPDS
jgi:hypothetical protein